MKILALLIPAIVVVLVYAPALTEHGLVWDDKGLLLDSPAYRDATGWLEALGQPLRISPNYFRPLVVLTFLVELALAGLNPTLFHMTNVLLHAANASLVAWLTLLLLPRGARWAPALAGVVYGLHPALTEPVVFVTGRFDLLCTFFVVAGLAWAVAFEDRGWLRSAGVGLAFLLAAFAKETAVVFPLLVFFWLLARGRTPRSLKLPTAIGVAGLVYLLVRQASLGYLLHPDGEPRLPAGDLVQHALLVARSLVEYASLVVWPFGTLTPLHYAQLPVPLGSVGGWVALALAVLLVSGIVVLIRREPVPGWLTLAGATALLPVLNLVPLNLTGGAFAAERYLTLPLALLVPAVFSLRFSGPQRIARTIGLLLLAAWLVASVTTIRRVLPHWRSDLGLWSWAVAAAPLSPVPHANLANALNDRGDHAAALRSAREAVERDAASGLAWNSLGRTQFMLDRPQEALESFDRATRLEPGRSLFWSNLGGVLLAVGRVSDAEVVLRDGALPLDPDNGFVHQNLGLVYLQQDRRELAREHLERARRLLPPGQRATADALLEQLGSRLPGP